MRVALVIHGHFRKFNNLWDDWKRNFIDPIKPDVFAFGWGDSMGNFLRPEQTPDPHNHPGYDLTSPGVTPEFINSIQQRLTPKKLIIENFSDWDQTFQTMIDDPKYKGALDTRCPSHRPKGTLGMVMARSRAINAKAEYERSQGFIYDLVVVTRWDVAHPELIRFTTDVILPDVVNACGGPHDRPWDWWTVGPSKLIDQFGDQYAGIEELVKINQFIFEPHLWQKAWFEHRKIPWRGCHNGTAISRN